MSVYDEMLARSYSYKPRKKNDEKPIIRFDNLIRTDRTLKNMNEYLVINPGANIVEMDTVIGKFEDKRCILTLYFRNSKLMLMFLIDKYKPSPVTKIFNQLRKVLGNDNGREFSKPLELEINSKTG